jgi:transposase
MKINLRRTEMKPTQGTDFTPREELLAVSLELSKGSWKIALHDGRRDKPAIHSVSSEEAGKRLKDAIAVIEATKAKWGISGQARVVVMYEAGQDGFWIQRALSELGYEALIVDPASIPVERSARRAKTDRLDAIKLVMCLMGWLRGERDRMHVIRIPTEEAEAQLY